VKGRAIGKMRTCGSAVFRTGSGENDELRLKLCLSSVRVRFVLGLWLVFVIFWSKKIRISARPLIRILPVTEGKAYFAECRKSSTGNLQTVKYGTFHKLLISITHSAAEKIRISAVCKT